MAMDLDILPPARIDLLVHSPSPAAFVPILESLLEPSPPLKTLLAPQLHSTIQSLPASDKPKTYSHVLDLAEKLVQAWDVEDQAVFLSSHPRIGETKNLSAASGKEQGGQTPGEVLRRLTILNSFFEESFPGLRFVTFVNGRTRAQIVPQIEVRPPLPLPPPSPTHATPPHPQSILKLSLPAPSPSTPEPTLGNLRKQTVVRIVGSKAWREELERGLKDMWEIARDRLGKMGVK